MASNFMGGFAKGFNQAYHTRRAEDRALNRDLFRDTWSRYHDSLDKRNAQKRQEDIWGKNADMLAQNDGEKQVFMNLMRSGMSFEEVQKWNKEYVVDLKKPQPQAPEVPKMTSFTKQPEGPEGLAAQEQGLNINQGDLVNSGRSPFASDANKMIGAKQNRAIEEVARRTGADPEEVRKALGYQSDAAPTDFIDVTIKPRSPQEMAYNENMTIEDIDDARKIAAVNGNTGRLKQLDALRKIKVDEEKYHASKYAPGEEVKFQKRDADGNLIEAEGLMNEDGWVRIKQPDGTLSEPKQVRVLGEAQPIKSTKPTPKGMTEKQLFDARNTVDQHITNYSEMVRITREVDAILQNDEAAAYQINEAFKALNMHAAQISHAVNVMKLPFREAVEQVVDEFQIDLPPGTSEIMFHMEDYTYSRLGINDQSGREASNPEVDRGLLRLMRAGPERLVNLMKTGNVRGREKAVKSYKNTTANLGPKYSEYWDDGWATADIDSWINNQLGDENLQFLGIYDERELMKQKREAEGAAPVAPVLVDEELGIEIYENGE